MDWTALDRELAAWSDSRRVARFWWRDDDAVAPRPALDRLIRTAAEATVEAALPLALAVIPAGAGPALAAALDGAPGVAILQHGHAHRNHAPPGEKKAEFGPHRPIAEMGAELARGKSHLQALFGERFRPVLVPPWNRIDPVFARELPRLGFIGLSTFASQPTLDPPVDGPDMAVVDTHIDIIDWRNGRGFVGEAAALQAVLAALRVRRRSVTGRDRPIGLLTHHAVHDSAAWAFVEAFAARIAMHPAACWLDPAALFPGPATKDAARQNQPATQDRAWSP